MKKIFLGILSLILIIGVILTPQNTNCVNASDLFDNFSSKSYVLLDKNSGEVIVEQNAQEKLPVASICKLMTSLLTLEKIDAGVLNLDTEVVASTYACSMEGSQAFLDDGCKYKVYDLLKSVIVASANDSSVVLAEAISGSEKEFVKLMNQRAKELGMTNTFYENANGLPTPNQHSTAMDTALILKEISKHDLYNEFSNIWMDKLIHPSGRETDLVNTNRLIKYYSYCLNGKTGFTDEAGYCLASTAQKDGLTLIAVVLNCKDAASRFSESIELFNYGFANFENKQILFKNEPISDAVKVKNGKIDSTYIGAENNFYVLNKKGENHDVSFEFDIPNSIKAPIKQGDVVGKCLIIKQGKVIAEENLIALSNIDKQNFKDILDKISNKWELI